MPSAAKVVADGAFTHAGARGVEIAVRAGAAETLPDVRPAFLKVLRDFFFEESDEFRLQKCENVRNVEAHDPRQRRVLLES